MQQQVSGQMKANGHCDEAAKVIEYYEHRNVDSDADVIALGQLNATLAVAFELRTANLIALQSTPGWLDEARERLGHPTAPAPAPYTSEGYVDKRCGERFMDGRNEIRCWLPVNHEGECK